MTNPTLNVTVTPPSGVAPLTVQFASPGVDSAGNTVTNWNWNFGDGGNSTAQNPSHVYTNIGAFSPSLVARSTYGTSPLAVTGLGVINVYSNSFPAFHTLYTFSPTLAPARMAVWSYRATSCMGRRIHGGNNGVGTVFAVNTDGTGFTNLYNFPSGNGGDPVGGLVTSGGALYGRRISAAARVAARCSPSTPMARVTRTCSFHFFNQLRHRLRTRWPDWPWRATPCMGRPGMAALMTTAHLLCDHQWRNQRELHDFTTPSYNANSYAINYDGIFPSARLMSSGGTLYGTTEQGGNNGSGTIFSVITNQPGSFYTVHYFAAVDPITQTNGEGAFSFSGLVLSGNNLYGTTLGGGTSWQRHGVCRQHQWSVFHQPL